MMLERYYGMREGELSSLRKFGIKKQLSVYGCETVLPNYFYTFLFYFFFNATFVSRVNLRIQYIYNDSQEIERLRRYGSGYTVSISPCFIK